MKKTLKVVAIPGAVLVLITLVSLIFSSGIKYEVVTHGQMEKTSSFSAVIIRDETVINSDKKGVLESLVKDREMVRKNKHVASIYETEIDEETKITLESINSRIEEIEKLKDQAGGAKSGVYHTERAMDTETEKIADAMKSGDMDFVVSSRDKLSLLNDKKNSLEKGTEYTDEVLAKLMRQKEDIEKKLGGSKQDIFAPAAGVYTTSTDGFEEILTPDAIGEMTPYDLESIKKMRADKENGKNKKSVCKIIDGTNWSVAFSATQKEISKLREGSGVYIRANGHEGDSKAVISYISTPVNGNYLVIATSRETAPWAMQERFADIELVKNKYSGLRVPIEALRVKDNETGVYTVLDGIVHFKKVKVLYKDTVYAIVEENNASQGGLLLYDEVIVSHKKELKEGMRIS